MARVVDFCGLRSAPESSGLLLSSHFMFYGPLPWDGDLSVVIHADLPSYLLFSHLYVTPPKWSSSGHFKSNSPLLSADIAAIFNFCIPICFSKHLILASYLIWSGSLGALLCSGVNGCTVHTNPSAGFSCFMLLLLFFPFFWIKNTIFPYYLYEPLDCTPFQVL